MQPRQFHFKDKLTKQPPTFLSQLLAAEISEVISQRVLPGSLVVAGAAARAGGGEGVTDLQELLKHCDVDMQKFCEYFNKAST